ncbi:hypothetical protein Tco_0935484 [Tanacetum coccineum]
MEHFSYCYPKTAALPLGKWAVTPLLLIVTGTDISQKDEKPIKKQQNRTRDGKVCEIEAKSKSSLLREEKAKKNIT